MYFCSNSCLGFSPHHTSSQSVLLLLLPPSLWGGFVSCVRLSTATATATATATRAEISVWTSPSLRLALVPVQRIHTALLGLLGRLGRTYTRQTQTAIHPCACSREKNSIRTASRLQSDRQTQDPRSTARRPFSPPNLAGSLRLTQAKPLPCVTLPCASLAPKKDHTRRAKQRKYNCEKERHHPQGLTAHNLLQHSSLSSRKLVVWRLSHQSAPLTSLALSAGPARVI
ncbi:hypothetical protein V8C26DRAFT_144507 [Trichoderma gracile]